MNRPLGVRASDAASAVFALVIAFVCLGLLYMLVAIIFESRPH